MSEIIKYRNLDIEIEDEGGDDYIASCTFGLGVLIISNPNREKCIEEIKEELDKLLDEELSDVLEE